MACRNICERFPNRSITGGNVQTYYEIGYKACIECYKMILIGEYWCPCCGQKMRTRSKHHKSRNHVPFVRI